MGLSIEAQREQIGRGATRVARLGQQQTSAPAVVQAGVYGRHLVRGPVDGDQVVNALVELAREIAGQAVDLVDGQIPRVAKSGSAYFGDLVLNTGRQEMLRRGQGHFVVAELMLSLELLVPGRGQLRIEGQGRLRQGEGADGIFQVVGPEGVDIGALGVVCREGGQTRDGGEGFSPAAGPVQVVGEVRGVQLGEELLGDLTFEVLELSRRAARRDRIVAGETRHQLDLAIRRLAQRSLDGPLGAQPSTQGPRELGHGDTRLRDLQLHRVLRVGDDVAGAGEGNG